MEIILPEIGVIFWSVLTFLIVWWVLRKFAWKPLLLMLNERDKSIDEALKSADKAREEMKKLEGKNEEMVKEAKLEREKLLKEARESQSQILTEARVKAKEEAAKMVEKARKEIEAERENAFNEMKSELAGFAVEIAEKIIRRELKDKEAQKNMVEDYIKDIKMN